MRSPKPEIRRPKEIRNPKPEGLCSDDDDSDFWIWGEELKSGPMILHDGPGEKQPPMDLTERTARFGEAIIEFAKKIPQNPVNNRLISQLVGAGTSVAANYYE